MARSSGKTTEAHGLLYVVAVPIGNADDLSARALRVLSEVDAIACEDTRRTGMLLAANRIVTPMLSYFEHNESRRVPELIERMTAGEKIALVTDAGTPAISDPGFSLVRAALEAGIQVTAVPGPSAVIAALSIAGLPTDRFTFEGFLPARDSARRASLEALCAERRTMVFYESARRLAETLAAMVLAFGEGRRAVVAREITKTYEETVRGTLGELKAHFDATPALGEVTLIVEGVSADGRDSDGTGAQIAGQVTVELLREAGLSLKQASHVIAKLTGRASREIYQNAVKSRENDESE
jgi:16S rRNA (cytidine1402-2'-O)-methyltransferase